MSHYDVLGVSPEVDAEELRRAFVRLARRFHPDRHVGADPATRREAERRMREITEAWAVLGDPVRRRRYDSGLGDRAVSGSGSGSGASPGSSGAGSRSGTTSRAGSARPTGAPSARTGSAAGTQAASGEGRSWRHYAPGSAAQASRSGGEQLLLLSPLLLVASAGFLAFFGLIIGWPPFFAMALVCLIGAAAAFFMLPIWAMTRSSARRGGRRPKRSY